MMRSDTLLLGLKNIGPTIAARYAAAGIRTVGDLRAIGPAEAHRRVKARYPGITLPVCYYLYSTRCRARSTACTGTRCRAR
jgi:DNA transformation protein and related proteins